MELLSALSAIAVVYLVIYSWPKAIREIIETRKALRESGARRKELGL